MLCDRVKKRIHIHQGLRTSSDKDNGRYKSSKINVSWTVLTSSASKVKNKNSHKLEKFADEAV